MFTPSQLEQMPIELERVMSDLERKIMEDIIRRIKINDEITRSADWQIYRLKQMGESDKYIKEQIQHALSLSDAEIDNLYGKVIQSGYARDKSLYEATGKQFIPFKENKELQQLINSVIVQTKKEMANITQTLGFAIDINGKSVFTPLADYYQNILDEAVTGVLNGTFDYNSTLKKTVKEMTKSGIRSVNYESGWVNRIEVASRRALMTGVTQVVGHINEFNARELETEYFEVSWHATARPSHQTWQGKVYTMEELKSICGLGSGPGLSGWNCYHSYYPFVPGVSVRSYTDKELEKLNKQENTPKTYNGKEYTKYEATQRQRQLEALMRKQRQDINLFKKAGATDETIDDLKSWYRGTMAQYVDFSKKLDLPQQRERIYMDGLGKVG